MNYLWGLMLLMGIVYGGINGTLGEVSQGVLSSSREAVALCISIGGILMFWSGIMQIASESGLVEQLTEKMDGMLSFLFPKLDKNSKARKAIALNMTANFLGLGWASTPAGLEAMRELKKEEERKKHLTALAYASDEMCTFLIINVSSLQLLPVTIVAYRSQYGSAAPMKIVGPAMVATGISTFAAILFCKGMTAWKGDKNETKS